MKHFILALIFLTGFHASFASGNKLNQTQLSVLDGSSIKAIPAFFWNTTGIQAEYIVGTKLGVGLNFSYAFGFNDAPAGFEYLPEEYLKSGLGVDLFAKFYFAGNAPEGLYGYANLSYNNMLFFDGNNRPYTIHNHWKEFDGTILQNTTIPNAFGGGVGAGYQVKLISHVIADASISLQLHPSNNGLHMSVYFLPSVGYVF